MSGVVEEEVGEEGEAEGDVDDPLLTEEDRARARGYPDKPGTRQVLIVPEAICPVYDLPHSPDMPIPMKTRASPQMI